jgi:superfamily II DNA/RNA helicase
LALKGFKNGQFKVLVATDIAARGIDVSGISHVINFDIPATVDAYTHRIGRTGRAACTGEAFTFASNEDRKILSQLQKIFGNEMNWVNSPIKTNGRSPAKPAMKKAGRKPGSRPVRNKRPAGAGRRQQAAASEKKYSQDVKRTSSGSQKKTGNRKRRNHRAAIMTDGSGNLFLNP